jgi:hypothetical protein
MSDIEINEIMASNIDCYFSPATNFDGWVEIRNKSDQDISLCNCYISDDENDLTKWGCPETMPLVPSHGYLVIWFDSNSINPFEADFKLDVDGGTIFISDETGRILVSQDYPQSISRTSYARIDNGNNWGVTCRPTPGFGNGIEGFFSIQSSDPIISQPSQLFDNSLTIKVDIPNHSKLIYTTDGSIPSENNGVISTDGMFPVSETTFLRFRLFESGKLPSNVVTRSYIKKEYDFTLPVVSIVSDNTYLYDDSVGILVKGKNGIPGNGSTDSCNWNRDWKRPAHFSYIMEKKSDIEQDVIIEVAGGVSRLRPIKSLKINGNKLFGSKNLNYPFFIDKPYIRNRSLLLRNGGNNSSGMIKDAALQTLMQRAGLNLESQCYQPVMYYLNGELQGLMNIREPNNKHYVYANYGLDDDEIDMFKSSSELLCGDNLAYERWFHLSSQVKNDVVLEEISKIVDVDEYLTYIASQSFLGHHDGWPKGNYKFFRPKDGKFRFISYDVDLAFENTFSPLDNDFYNSEKINKSAQIFVNMLSNDTFRRKFVDYVCIMGGAVFLSSHAEKLLDSLAFRIEKMMSITNKSPWNTINSIKESLKKQNEIIVNKMIDFDPLMLKDVKFVHAKMSSDTKGCVLFLNDVVIPYSNFDGIIFTPAKIKAIAPSGYNFVGWRKNVGQEEFISNDSQIDAPNSDFSLVACFVPMNEDEKNNVGIKPVMINEISPANDSFINDYYKKEDWIELFNTTSMPIDVEGMWLSDDSSNLKKYKISRNNSYVSTIIPPNGYLIIWCDKLEPIYSLHASFKLDADGGNIYLTSADGANFDHLYYSQIDKSETVGRFPDGGKDFYRMDVPTIGRTNLYTTYMKKEGKNTDINNNSIIVSDSEIKIKLEGRRLIVKTNTKCADLRIFSVTGQVAYSKMISVNGIEEIDLNSLPKGCYYAKVTNDRNNSCVYKFLFY